MSNETKKRYAVLANARLIAAAPELLEACDTLADLATRIACQPADILPEILRARLRAEALKAMAVLAKATGA